MRHFRQITGHFFVSRCTGAGQLSAKRSGAKLPTRQPWFTHTFELPARMPQFHRRVSVRACRAVTIFLRFGLRFRPWIRSGALVQVPDLPLETPTVYGETTGGGGSIHFLELILPRNAAAGIASVLSDAGLLYGLVDCRAAIDIAGSTRPVLGEIWNCVSFVSAVGGVARYSIILALRASMA